MFSNETKLDANVYVDTYIQWLQLQLQRLQEAIDYKQLQVKFFNQTKLDATKNTDTYIQWLQFYFNNEYGISLDFLTSAVKGDMLFYNGTTWTKLNIGNDTQVLTVDVDVPIWADSGSGGGSLLSRNR